MNCCGPQVANVSWRVGEDWVIEATMHDSQNEILNIATATVLWRLALDGLIIITLSIGNGITLVNGGIGGECIIKLTPAQQLSLGIVPTVYQHECQVILSDGTRSDQFAGNVVARPSLFPPT